MVLIGRARLKEITGVSTSTTDRWERAGLLPRAIRSPGMRPRWDEEEVLAAVEKLKQNRTQKQEEPQAVAAV